MSSGLGGRQEAVGQTYTWTLVVLRTPTLGVRGARKSEAAIKLATTKATVVKKPKAFWRRTMEEYIVGDGLGAVCALALLEGQRRVD